MTTKRITAVLAAAAVCAASGVTASAAGKYQLLTEPVSVIDGAESVGVIYDVDGRANAPLISKKDDTVITGVFDITQKDLKKWRSSGEFTYTEVNADGFEGAEYFNNADVGMNYYSDVSSFFLNDGSVFWYTYDGSVLKSAPSYDYWRSIRFNGYELSGYAEGSVLNLFVTNYNDETPTAKEIAAVATDGYVNYASAEESDKYIGYWIYSTDHTDEGDGVASVDFNIDGITLDGERETIYSNSDVYYPSLVYSANNYLLFFYQPKSYVDGYTMMYLTETDEVIKMPSYISNGLDYSDPDYESILFEPYRDNSTYFYTSAYAGKLNGNKLIVWSGDGDYRYHLIEIGSEKDENGYTSCRIISDEYKYMTTYDGGETYLVQTLDGKWGFLNSEGKLVATYDEAGAFMGNYAPVVKDGKAYLVNRNFRCVSEKIDAESVSTLDNGLYNVTIDGENYFMTYSKNKDNEAANDPQETEQTPDETADSPSDTDATTSEAQDDQTVSEPTDTETSADTSAEDTSADNKDESKDNPDTGAASAGIAVGLTVFAAGAVLLSRKRR